MPGVLKHAISLARLACARTQGAPGGSVTDSSAGRQPRGIAPLCIIVRALQASQSWPATAETMAAVRTIRASEPHSFLYITEGAFSQLGLHRQQASDYLWKILEERHT
jgi:hypothetical protein